MIENLISFIDKIKKDSRTLSYSEDQTKMAIIQPLLRRLGWDTENVEEVYPEFSVENRRVDYALRLKGRNAVFIEAKKPSEDLESKNHQEQLLDYSFREGIPLAVLTNGITWSFYLPRAGGDWKSRKFYTIDIIEQETSSIASNFIDLLSKNNIESGKALKSAEKIHEGKLKEKAIRDALPEAWNRIIEGTDSPLVELIAERTERICSYKPEPTEVINFLKLYQSQFLLLPTEEQLETEEEPRVKANDIYTMFKDRFDHPWYQEKVAGGVPRWQHNIAWGRMRAKKRGLVREPTESGRGFWALTDKGMNFS